VNPAESSLLVYWLLVQRGRVNNEDEVDQHRVALLYLDPWTMSRDLFDQIKIHHSCGIAGAGNSKIMLTYIVLCVHYESILTTTGSSREERDPIPGEGIISR
jgi:hypothetical protein